MNNYQRGIYQPLADKVPFYDLEDKDDPEEERSRAPLLVVIALVLLAAFVGVVWLSYTQGAERGWQGASLAITEPEGPVRVAPPEVSPAPLGLDVYKSPVSPEQEITSAVAPPTTTKAEPPPIRLSQPALPPAPAAQASKAEPAAKTSAVAPPTTTKAEAPSVAASAAARRAVSGAAVLQLGAFDSQELAARAWVAFRARYPSVSRRLSPAVQRADLGAKGIMYRLRAGPFADRAAATNACVQLKAAGANCFVAAP